MRRSGLEAAISEIAEIVYVNAPNLASGPIPDDVAPFFKGPYYEWWNADRDENGEWWIYKGWEKTLAHLEDVFNMHGPFDGIMGFSQGGAVASLTVGMQRAGCFLKDQPQLKFCICFAGIRVRARVKGDAGEVGNIEGIYRSLRDCPSLHVIGDKDPVKRMTNDLINSFDNPVVINHTKGHVIPALQGPDLQRFKAFLQSHHREASL